MSENKVIAMDQEAFAFCIGKAIRESAKEIYGEKLCEGLYIEDIVPTAVKRSWNMLAQLHEEAQWPTDAEQIEQYSKQAAMAEAIISKLWKDAHYAADSYSLNLMYQTYGELHMAVFSGLVKYEQVREISEYITVRHFNNGAWRRMCEKQYELAE